MKCQKCQNGIVLVPNPKYYYKEGDTTRKMEPDLCKCCKGDYRDCKKCAKEQEEQEESR